MRILVAVDEKAYSGFAVREAVKLAVNTWADVTLLGIHAKTVRGTKDARDIIKEWDLYHPLAKALHDYRGIFQDNSKGEDSPYGKEEWRYQLVGVDKGVWEELYVRQSARKDLKVRVRQGNPVKEILAESRREGCDLIVIGCSHGKRCAWDQANNIPQKVVADANCSVLMVKEERPIRTILCCLDQASVTQESLEMINQLVTINQAKLELVGLAVEGGIKVDVDEHLAAIQKYYAARGIDTWVRLIETSSLETFISKDAQQDLLALWMGKKSILDRIFARDWVGKLAGTSQSSVLILR